LADCRFDDLNKNSVANCSLDKRIETTVLADCQFDD